jgi:hypothetical protein
MFSVVGCKKENPSNVDTHEFEKIKSSYGGRYKILSSVANEPVDLNLDGSMNTNLFEELSGISQSKVTIRVTEDLDPRSTKKYITSFDLSYPEQYALSDGREISSFNPSAEVIFLDQPIGSRCNIDPENKSINLLPEENPYESVRHFTKPNEIKLLDSEKMQISTIKEFYTQKGFIKINIISVYEREN